MVRNYKRKTPRKDDSISIEAAQQSLAKKKAVKKAPVKKRASQKTVSVKEAQDMLAETGAIETPDDPKDTAAEKEKRRIENLRKKNKRDELNFSKALSALPISASAARELNWIRSHPAMSRRARTTLDDPVVISKDDILKAPHGEAPSQGAVHQLQHWVNKPDEFFKQLMQENRKKVKDIADISVDSDDDDPHEIKSIDELLACLDGALAIDD